MIDLWLDFQFDFASAGNPVFAYLDPGTGSYALQVLLAALFGGMFAWKQAWAGLKFWFGSLRGGGPAPTPHDDPRLRIHGQPTAKLH